MSENELVEKCKSGDETAYKSLYDIYSKHAMSICVRYIGDEMLAEDVLHDGFIKIFSSIRSFQYLGEGSLKAWLSRIFCNESLYFLRKNKIWSQTVPVEGYDVPEEEPDISLLKTQLKNETQPEHILESQTPVLQDVVEHETIVENTSPEKDQSEISKAIVSPQILENEDIYKPKQEFKLRQDKNKLQLSVLGKNILAMNKNLDTNEIQGSSTLRSYLNSNNIGSNIAFQGPSQDELIGIDYELPLNFGLLVRKNFNSNWGIETGLSYTYLVSREKWRSMEYGMVANNRIALHYLGIPAKVSYTLLSHKKLSVYLSGGGMIEKCISGEIQTTERITDFRMKKPLSITEWQLSCMGSIGFGLRLFSPVSLIVEPGFSYFPDDGNNIMTIRKDKPFMFNMQAGLRFDINK